MGMAGVLEVDGRPSTKNAYHGKGLPCARHRWNAGGIQLIPAPVNFQALRRKVAWRVLPLVFLLYIVAYLDRANVGFAKLRMASDLKFSE